MNDATATLVARLSTDRIEEVKYLIEAKVSIYRPIVAFLHDRLEETETGWVWPHEVAVHIRRVHPDADAYTDDECRRDLETLEGWGVLLSEQDVSNATTLEEFLRAARRYQISERARRIERMVRDLEGERGLHGSLDPDRLRRLWIALVELDRILADAHDPLALSEEQLGRIEGEWHACEDARTQIDEQALRYLNDLNQKQNDRTEGDLQIFIAYRTLLRNYIDEFLLDLKDFRVRCGGLFREWLSKGTDERLAAALVQNARRKGDERPDADLLRAAKGHVRKLVGFPGPDGTARILERKTTTRLMMLIGQVERMVLERQSVIDRTRDLENLALAFRNTPNDESAHDLAAVVFGWGTPQHMHSYSLEDDDLDPTISAWIQPPCTVELRQAVRGNHEFQSITPVRDRRAERARLRLERAAERRREKAFWDRLFASGEIDLDGLTLPDSLALNRVTRLLRDCMRRPDLSTRLFDGSEVVLCLPEDVQAVAEVRVPGGVYHTRPFRLRRLPAEVA